MPTPLEFREQYFNIPVEFAMDDAMVCRAGRATVKLNKYFMMSWVAGKSQLTSFNAVTSGSTKDTWFKLHKEHIRCAAMGKGSPDDYALALEWAVMSKHIKVPSQLTIQKFFDDNMGLDCSGFATNYLIANGKKPDTVAAREGTGASSYYDLKYAVNDPSGVKQGDLLVFMDGNRAMEHHKDGTGGTGHVMVVESFDASCSVQYPYGSMRVVESTGAKNATPKLSDSIYTIEKIIPKAGAVPCMILVNKRLGSSNFHVSVMRY